MEIVSKGAYALKHSLYVGIKKYFSVKSSLALQTARGLCTLSVGNYCSGTCAFPLLVSSQSRCALELSIVGSLKTKCSNFAQTAVFQSGVASPKWSCVWLPNGEAGYSNTSTVLWLNHAAGLLKERFPSASLCKSMLLINFSLQPVFLLQMWEWVLMLQIRRMILEIAKSDYFFRSQIMQFSFRPNVKQTPLEK